MRGRRQGDQDTENERNWTSTIPVKQIHRMKYKAFFRIVGARVQNYSKPKPAIEALAKSISRDGNTPM